MANLSREAREDRKQKEAVEIMNRSDNEYLEIEQFKEYEFSWCIAFEMAKHNPELLREARRFIEFYKDHQDQIDFIPHSDRSFRKRFKYRLHRRAKAIFENGYNRFAQTYWLAPVDLYHITMDETAKKMAEVYERQFQDVERQPPGKRFAEKNYDGVLFRSSIVLHDDQLFRDNAPVSDKEIAKNIEDFNTDPILVESRRRAMESFSRPKLSIPDIYNKNVQIELNLSLPKNELLAFVSLVKEKYDEQKEIVKSPIELLGAKLSSAGFEEIDAEQMYKKDRRKTLPEKCADMFFIYDCYVNNLSMGYTIDGLNRYWIEERKAFPDKFQIKTYKLYLRTAQKFINKRKYRSFLMGQ